MNFEQPPPYANSGPTAPGYVVQDPPQGYPANPGYPNYPPGPMGPGGPYPGPGQPPYQGYAGQPPYGFQGGPPPGPMYGEPPKNTGEGSHTTDNRQTFLMVSEQNVGRLHVI